MLFQHASRNVEASMQAIVSFDRLGLTGTDSFAVIRLSISAIHFGSRSDVRRLRAAFERSSSECLDPARTRRSRLSAIGHLGDRFALASDSRHRIPEEGQSGLEQVSFL
jgi:hypothetical protein